MWTIFVEFSSATSKIRQRKKEEDRRNTGKICPPTHYVGRPIITVNGDGGRK